MSDLTCPLEYVWTYILPSIDEAHVSTLLGYLKHLTIAFKCTPREFDDAQMICDDIHVFGVHQYRVPLINILGDIKGLNLNVYRLMPARAPFRPEMILPPKWRIAHKDWWMIYDITLQCTESTTVVLRSIPIGRVRLDDRRSKWNVVLTTSGLFALRSDMFIQDFKIHTDKDENDPYRKEMEDIDLPYLSLGSIVACYLGSLTDFEDKGMPQWKILSNVVSMQGIPVPDERLYKVETLSDVILTPSNNQDMSVGSPLECLEIS